MGSTQNLPPSSSSSSSLPDASSPSLILTRPTAQELARTWSLTHPMWGPALSHDDYLKRELYLTTVPLAKDGGLSHWILTIASQPPDQRPILSSCESLRKMTISAPHADGAPLVDGVAHGIGSVFTDPQFRGRGYASRMMQELGRRLRRWQVANTADMPDDIVDASDDPSKLGPQSLFSVLYSDIGKTFYARSGWAPFESSHVAFPAVPGAASGLEPQNGYRGARARAVGYHELAELCSADEELLRAGLLARRAKGGKGGGKTCVALLPSLDQLLWHLMREDFMTKHIFGRTPAVKGAVYGDEVGRRVWAVWTRGYYGGLDKVEGNTLFILRFVVEGVGDEKAYLREGVRAIVQIAQAEAAEWRSQDVQMWNPDERVRGLIEASGLKYEYVERDKESITSLMWYGEGEGSTEELDWVANEKYGWC
ncbi:hypothetical protein B0T17DRAFT_482579 [Bombardia bombarda]|uniref:LYC1 C-terminal domain-containing protein n=1 Tax=Bombardia bombarda TaxID=252184 RepID=A0AA40CGI2_9PEZI|nr:hypothetical protein B0T17DRAFT_482579 [Bombardia bombarda]